MRILVIDFDTPMYEQSLVQREKWLRIPLGLRWDPADRPAEVQDTHIVAVEEDEIIGVMVLTPVDERTVRMRQVAVNPEIRSRGIGSQMVRFAKNWAKENGIHKIILHAREGAVEFYKRLDYQVTSDVFYEVTIPHFMMEKEW